MHFYIKYLMQLKAQRKVLWVLSKELYEYNELGNTLQ